MTEVANRLTDLSRLAPCIDAAKASIDVSRRLPRELFAALADAGLFRLWLPRALGGPELSPFEIMEVVEEAAKLNGSVGWLVGNGAGASRIAGYVSEDAALHYFGDPRAFVVTATGAVGTAIPVDNGYRVTGRWPYGSGIHGATGLAGLCALPSVAGPPHQIICLAPASAGNIFDTWDVSGLRGTGSCDWTLDDVFVPALHSFAFPDQPVRQPGIVYRLPAISMFAWSVAVVPLALARACFDAVVEMARDRKRLGTSQPLRDEEIIQSEMGRADAQLRSARAFLVGAMGDLIGAVEQGAEDLVPYRADLRLAAAYAAETALGVAAMLEVNMGASAMFESGPLAGRLRDLRAAVQHIAVSPNNFVIAARLRLGLDPGTTRI